MLKNDILSASMLFAFVTSIRPADDSTILYMCDLNALGGFNFYTEGGRLAPGYPMRVL